MKSFSNNLPKPHLSRKNNNSYDIFKLNNNIEAGNLKEDVGNLEKWFNDQKIKFLTKDEEKNYLTEAKNQVMKKHLELEREKFKKNQEPVLNQNLLNFCIFDKNLENFQENERDKEKMKETSRKKKNLYTFNTDSQDQKKYEAIKSMDAIKNEFRRQILSQILVDKILKRKKNEKSSITSSNITNFDQNNILAYASIPNFKCLKKNEGSNPQNLIEFDFLRDKLNEFQQKPKKHFELGVYEAELTKISNDLKSLEEILLGKFQEINEEIVKKKKLAEEFRNTHSNLTNTFKRLKDEREILIGKFNNIEQKLMSSLDKNEVLAKQTQAKGNKVPMSSDFIKLEKFRGEKSNQQNKISRSIAKNQMEINENKMKLNELNRELKTMNFNKLNLKLHIRDIYYRMLRNNDEAIRHHGLIWLIKAFWNINEEIPFDMFPKNIDEVTKKFLNEYCKLDVQISYQNDILRKKQKEFTREKLLQKHIEGQKLIDYHQNINKSQINEKVFHLKRNFLNTHQLSLPSSFNKTNFTFYEDSTPVYLNSNPYFDQYKSYKTFSDADLSSFSMNLMTLQAKSQELKEKEIFRLFDIYKEKNIDEISRLKEKFALIFGENESQIIFDKNSQKINKKMGENSHNFEKDQLNHMNIKENRILENIKITENFNKLKSQMFNSNNLPDYNNSYLFFK